MAAAGSGAAAASAVPAWTDFRMTDDHKAFFDREGYVVVRGILSGDEVGVVKREVERGDGIAQYCFERDDGAGRKSKMSLFNYAVGENAVCRVARLHKVAGSVESLLEGPVMHYHTKLVSGGVRDGMPMYACWTQYHHLGRHPQIMKEAYSGGRFAWHQDYGYWFANVRDRGWLSTSN